jgi:hypothetical protein
LLSKKVNALFVHCCVNQIVITEVDYSFLATVFSFFSAVHI